MPTTSSTLQDIDARLARIEAVVGRLADVLDQAPAAISVAGDAVDEILLGAGPPHEVDARVQRTVGLLGQLTEPRTLDALEQIVAWTQRLPELPNITALMLDAFDEVMTAIREHGVNLEQTLADLNRSGILQADSLNFLLEAAGALVDAGKAADGEKRVGFFGLLKATRDPDVQRALAFLIDVARRLGALVQSPARPALTHQEL